MARAVLMACVPWFALLVVSFVLLYAIGRFCRGRFDLGRLRRLHADEVGAVQSLSFVLTLPLFIMVMLLIVQVSQLMIATIVVHYAAYASARSASVWIPAYVSPAESENAISFYRMDPDAPQNPPVVDPDDPNYAPSSGGVTFIVEPGSQKYDKIRSAAVLACVPISPSRNVGLGVPLPFAALGDSLKTVYRSMVAGQTYSGRIDYKLAWAAQNTTVELRFFHSNQEPPLVTYFLPTDPYEFRYNELGWQDQITVRVWHHLALLPGPGRLLARYVRGPKPDKVSQHITEVNGVYVYPLHADCVISNEGEKAVISYAHQP